MPPETPTAIALTVSQEEGGLRLDRWLAQRLTGMSRARLQELIGEGCVTLARETIGEPSKRVKPGQTYGVVLPEAKPPELEAQPLPLQIVFEDDDVIVIDKPAGLVVHPAAGHASGTLVNAVLAHCGEELAGIGGVRRPGIVHRLDKDTSGLIVVAKSERAHRSLSEQFKSHGLDGRLQRVYLALVWGVPLQREGMIDAPLGRSVANRLKIAVARNQGAGRRAVTHYRVLKTFAGTGGEPAVSLLELQLETGRTHQIRVHLAHIGHPVLGDPLYGAGFKTRSSKLSEAARGALASLNRQALHAAVLGFEHPGRSRPMKFTSEIPNDIQELVESLSAGKATSAKPAKDSRPNHGTPSPEARPQSKPASVRKKIRPVTEG